MSKNNKRLVFLLPILILIGMTIKPILTIYLGDEVYLTTEPVDPRDLFRGDYVTLQYEAEVLPVNKIDEDIKQYFKEKEKEAIPYGSLNVYAVLKETPNGVHEVERVVKEKPKTGIYLKGEINHLWSYDEEVTVYYNLDKYFVPENTGSVLEDAIRTTSSDDNELTNVVAVIKVRDGHAILSDVKVNK